MIRPIKDQLFTPDNKRYLELVGTSQDTKPTGDVITGSIFVEIDTGNVYFYNEDATAGSEWVEQFSFQG